MISVAAFIVAMYYNYSAAEAIPTPLQMWLDRCRFGSRLRKDSANAYKTLQEELDAFKNTAMKIFNDLCRWLWQRG